MPSDLCPQITIGINWEIWRGRDGVQKPPPPFTHQPSYQGGYAKATFLWSPYSSMRITDLLYTSYLKKSQLVLRLDNGGPSLQCKQQLLLPALIFLFVDWKEKLQQSDRVFLIIYFIICMALQHERSLLLFSSVHQLCKSGLSRSEPSARS